MWLFTTGGFLSAVEHRDDKNMLMVRARDKQSLETMLEGIELAGAAEGKETEKLEIVQKLPSDYPWRVEVTKATFALFVQHEIMNYLNYHNFKSAVTEIRGNKWHNAAMNVWVDMLAVSDVPDTNHYGPYQGGLGSTFLARDIDEELHEAYSDLRGSEDDEDLDYTQYVTFGDPQIEKEIAEAEELERYWDPRTGEIIDAEVIEDARAEIDARAEKE